MKSCNYLLLQYIVQVNEHIATAYKIDLGKWGIFKDIMWCKYAEIPDTLNHAIISIDLDKKSLYSSGRHLCQFVTGINTQPGFGYGRLAQVSCENLNGSSCNAFSQEFHHCYGNRI